MAASMLRRGNKGTVDQFEELARVYNKRLISYCSTHGYMTVEFNDLIYNTEETAKRIGDYIGVDLKDTSFIEPTIANRVA